MHLEFLKDFRHFVDWTIREGDTLEGFTPLAVGLAAQHLAQLSHQLQPVLDSPLVARIPLLSRQVCLAHSEAQLGKLVVVAAANC